MNAFRRRVLVATAALAPQLAIAGGLGRLARAISGKSVSSVITLVLVDQSASINAEDATIYRQGFAAFCASVNAGDRFVIGAIADRAISRFVPLADRSIPRKGISLDDREAVAKAKQELDAAFSQVLAPRARANRSFIFDAINAGAEILASAHHERKRLVLLTDGVEESTSANFARLSLDARTAHQLIERRKAATLIPSLEGVDVWVIGAGGASNEKYVLLRNFWTAYFVATGGKLAHYGRGVPEMR